MRTQHTPGPWEISSSVIVVSNKSDTLKIICSTASFGAIQEHAPSMEEAMANAKLIAVAPRMLDLLRALSSVFNHPNFTDRGGYGHRIDGMIAEAEGRE